MDKNSIKENKAIQDGLEKFLEQEINVYGEEPAGSVPVAPKEKTLKTEFAQPYHAQSDRIASYPKSAPTSQRSASQSSRSGQKLQEDLMHVRGMAQGQEADRRLEEEELQRQQELRRLREEQKRRAEQQHQQEEKRRAEQQRQQEEKRRAEQQNRQEIESRRRRGEQEVQDALAGEEWEDEDRPLRRKRTQTRTKETDRSGRRKAASKPRRAEKKKSRRGSGGKGSGKKKTSKAKKVLIILLLVALALLLWWFVMVHNIYSRMNYEKADELVTGPMKEDGVINVLLIGNDSRENGEDGRSDAMILVSISNKTKTIHMTSLLRDMYVEIPGHDGNRLNAAYAYGGASLLCETIEQNLGIEVNRYALVNFQAFANLVDAVGGVDLEVTSEEVKWINAYLNEYNLLEGKDITTDYLDESLSGELHLNGPQALAYSRNRYIGTDFGRTERQRKVLSAVMKKLPLALATNSGELIDGLFPNLTTNLKQTEVYSLSLDAGKLLTYDVVQMAIPAEGTYSNATIRDMAVLQVDFEANKAIIQKEIYGK